MNISSHSRLQRILHRHLGDGIKLVAGCFGSIVGSVAGSMPEGRPHPVLPDFLADEGVAGDCEVRELALTAV